MAKSLSDLADTKIRDQAHIILASCPMYPTGSYRQLLNRSVSRGYQVFALVLVGGNSVATPSPLRLAGFAKSKIQPLSCVTMKILSTLRQS